MVESGCIGVERDMVVVVVVVVAVAVIAASGIATGAATGLGAPSPRACRALAIVSLEVRPVRDGIQLYAYMPGVDLALKSSSLMGSTRWIVLSCRVVDSDRVC